MKELRTYSINTKKIHTYIQKTNNKKYYCFSYDRRNRVPNWVFEHLTKVSNNSYR